MQMDQRIDTLFTNVCESELLKENVT